MSFNPAVEAAINRWGPKINRLARTRYGISGKRLLRGLITVESNGRHDAVSSAGARGETQFIPSSRQEAIRKFGVDPWKDADSAAHAAVLHLQGKINGKQGLEGYNPGDAANYTAAVLKAAGGGSVKSAPPVVGGSVTVGGGQSTDLDSILLDRLMSKKKGSLAKYVTAAIDSGRYTNTEPKRTMEYGGTTAAGGATLPGKIIGVPHQGTHTLGNWQSDNAIDVSMKMGTRVNAPGGGVVEKISGGWAGGASRFDGYQVTIRLNDGNRIFLTHLKSLSKGLKVGARVGIGAPIGRSGAANGVPHVHVAIEKGDPRKYFR